MTEVVQAGTAESQVAAISASSNYRMLFGSASNTRLHRWRSFSLCTTWFDAGSNTIFCRSAARRAYRPSRIARWAQASWQENISAADPFRLGTRFDVIPGHANEYFSDQNFATVERLCELSARTGIRMVQLALGWVLKNSDVTGTLIGARDESQIDNALNALANPLPIEITEKIDSWQDARSQLDS